MTAVKKTVLEEIEQGLTALRAESFCTCQYSQDATGKCNHCVVDYALRRAKTCIIASGYRDLAISLAMDDVQGIIENKVRALVRGNDED